MTNKDAQGNTTMDFPITKVENVEGAVKQVDSNIKTFTSLAQLGLDNNATIEQICEALPANSTLLLDVSINNFPNFVTPTFDNDGQLIVTSNGTNRVNLTFKYTAGEGNNRVYTANYANWVNPKFSGWQQFALKGALSMPNDTQFISINVTPNVETYYTSPADGWLTAYAGAKNATGRIYFSVGVIQATWNASGVYTSGFFPVAKGFTVYIKAVDMANDLNVKFVYAQSEV